MFWNAVFQVGIFLAIVTALSVPLGLYMARVFAHEPTFLDPVLAPIERLIYRVCGIHPGSEMTWVEYAVSMLLFSMVGMLVLYAMERLQYFLPLNPQEFAGVAPDLAFNTAASFTTNTNWQAYGGESTMSYFTQMAGLAFHNFVSAAAGIAIAIAVIRGFVRRSAKTIGNFWVDLTRATCGCCCRSRIVFALVLVWQGVPQNFSPYTQVKTVEGAEQVIAQGPVASQEIIKELGTNGGGFFNANSAHPYENPTPLTNLLELRCDLRDRRRPDPYLRPDGRRSATGLGAVRRDGAPVPDGRDARDLGRAARQSAVRRDGHQSDTPARPRRGGNMEGKEVRFGIVNSALWATVTTDTSCGAVNSMHDSFTPLGGLVPLLNMQIGEIIFGGVGSGLYGMLVMAVLSVFIAGLMVGRTPEYLGKKIEGARDEARDALHPDLSRR